MTYSDHKIVLKTTHSVLKLIGYFWICNLTDNSWGFGIGEKIDHMTFITISDGPLSGVGSFCLITFNDLPDLFKDSLLELENVELETKTYRNHE
ncbi:MAG: hypothetical protein HeimC3_24990 [Candidatus Heimdallarchaeota archaeon LC_3]|nr:MAG: hypothetical protein HeimC3_24990 [Candidatus Heimdallarchaeota archaeon LC_3]